MCLLRWLRWRRSRYILHDRDHFQSNSGLPTYGVIENVVTAAALRGRGYATAVLRAGLNYAWVAGCYK